MFSIAFRRTARIALFLFGTALPAVPPAVGQAPTHKVSIAEALDLFGRNNQGLKLARLRAAEMSALARQAAMYPNPSVSFTHEPLSNAGERFSESYATLSQRLEWPGLRRARIEAATQLALSANASLEADSLRLAFDVKSAFVDAIAARERVSILDSVTVLFRTADRSTRAMRDAGEVSGFDLRRLRVERARYENLLAEAELEVFEAERQLKLLVAPEDPGSRLSPAEESLDRPGEWSLDAALERARTGRSELRSAIANVVSAEADVRFSLLKNRPEPTIEAGYKRQSDGFKGAFFGLSTALPVFDRNQGATEAKQSSVHAAETRLLLTQRLVENDVRQTYEVYSSLSSRHQLFASELLDEVDALLEAAETGYSEGEMPLVSLLDAAEAYRDAKSAMIDLRRDLQIAYYDLHRAVGAVKTSPDP